MVDTFVRLRPRAHCCPRFSPKNTPPSPPFSRQTKTNIYLTLVIRALEGISTNNRHTKLNTTRTVWPSVIVKTFQGMWSKLLKSLTRPVLTKKHVGACCTWRSLSLLTAFNGGTLWRCRSISTIVRQNQTTIESRSRLRTLSSGHHNQRNARQPPCGRWIWSSAKRIPLQLSNRLTKRIPFQLSNGSAKRIPLQWSNGSAKRISLQVSNGSLFSSQTDQVDSSPVVKRIPLQ